MSAQRVETGRQRALRRGAHLAVLSTFALAQPLLDILGRNAEFFAARGSPSREIVLFAVLVTLVPPAFLLALELLAGLVSGALAGALHLVFVGGLSAVIVLHALTKADALSGVAALVVAAAAGAVAAVVYRQAQLFRTFLGVLVPVPLVFLALFLFTSQASKLVFAAAPDANAANVAADTPVVLVVFDELTTVSLMNRRGEVDAVRYPSFAALAGDSTWFRSATTADWLTEGNVPAILSGLTPARNRLPIYSQYPNNLFTLLGGSYQLKVLEAITHLCPPKLCRGAPKAGEAAKGSLASDAGIVYLHLLVPEPYSDQLPAISDTWGNFGGRKKTAEPTRRTASGAIEACGRRVCDFTDLISNDRKPTLYFLHTVLPHWPFVYLPSGRRWAVDERPLLGYSAGYWQTEAAALDGEQRYLLQLGYSDRALGLILKKLRDTGIYDKALVIVTGDEGESFRGGDQRRRATQGNLDDIAFVPLFVKLPGQTDGRIDDSYAPSLDILPTIAHVLGVSIPWQIDGRSLVGSRLPADATVSVLSDGRVVRARLSALRAKRERTLAKQIRLFGTGSMASVYRYGPQPQLLGRRVGSITVRPGGTTGVKIHGRSFLDAVDPKSEFLPTYIEGTLTGRHAAEVDLAIAVNGTIAASTRSFVRKGETRFAAFVPEETLRAGRNAVDVFAVRKAGATTVLERLRGGDIGLVLRKRGGRELIESADGQTFRIDRTALHGTVKVTTTNTGFAFNGRAAGGRPLRPADVLAVFLDGRAVFEGQAEDLRPLKFLGQDRQAKDHYSFELPRAVLPAPGRGHRVRVFATRGGAAAELRYVGTYPWLP